jgi:hypothetical protein
MTEICHLEGGHDGIEVFNVHILPSPCPRCFRADANCATITLPSPMRRFFSLLIAGDGNDYPLQSRETLSFGDKIS